MGGKPALGGLPVCAKVEVILKSMTRIQGDMMKSSTRDKTEGNFHEMQGKIKEKLGLVMKNPSLEARGKTEKRAGKVQKWIGRAKKAVGQ
jgi:uncharacterized protein YjbJ (UPF0337 family)